MRPLTLKPTPVGKPAPVGKPTSTAAAPLAALYWLTHESAFDSEAHFFDSVEYALQQGLGSLQYRDKSQAAPNFDRLNKLQQLCSHYDCYFILNDQLDVAAQLGCGLHLGKDDYPVTDARQRLPTALIGASCYQDVARALALQPFCDYVAFGAFYPSTTKPQATQASLALLVQARQQLHCPIVVIGGITPHKVQPLLQAGADRIAVSAALHDANTFKSTLTLFANQFNHHFNNQS